MTADHAELWANTNANHTRKTFFQFSFLADIFHVDANERICFVFENFQLLPSTQKIKTTFHFASYLLVLHLFKHLLGQTKWSWPFSLSNHNRGKQLLCLKTQLICLFQNSVNAKPSGICGPLWEKSETQFVTKLKNLNCDKT